MADSDTNAATLEVGRPLTVGAVTLLPIERTVVRAGGQDAHTWLFASKDLYAIVLSDAAGTRAVDADAAEIPLEQLLEKVPQLDAALRSTDPRRNHGSSK